MIYDANGNKVRPMTRADRLVRLMLILLSAWWMFFLALVAYGSEITHQVSHGQPFSSVYLPSLPVATSTHVVYAQDAATDGAFDLWSASIDGGAPVRLSSALAVGQSVKFKITPDGQRVVYSTDQTTRGIPDLYSVPIAGGASVKLSMDLSQIPGQVRDFLISPTSQRAYYAADGVVNNKMELWAVSVLGGPSIRLNHRIDVATDVFEYQVSPQDVLAYRAGQSSGSGDFALYSVRGDGLAPAVKISRQMVTGGGVDATFSITSDGETVLYIADAEDNGEFNAYSVNIRGGASHRLNATVDGGVVDVLEEPLSGGARAIYAQRSASVSQWWSVPVTGGTPVAVPPPMPEPVRSPDGQWIVYGAGVGLWSSGDDGGHQLVSCAGQSVTATFLASPAYSVSPDSKRVVYITGGEVWTSPISGSVCLIFRDGFEGGNFGGWR